MSFFTDLLYKTKIINESDYIIAKTPKNEIANLLLGQKKLDSIGLYSDPAEASKELQRFEKEVERVAEKYWNNFRASFISGYEPAGSTIRRLFPKPFEPFAFVGDNYWAAAEARRQSRIEIERDGYTLVAETGQSKRKLKYVYTALESLNIGHVRVNAADQLNVFGNCWMWRSKNNLGGLTGLNFLLPEKMIPVLDDDNERVIRWEYHYGSRKIIIPLESLDHLKTYSLRSLDLGVPSLAPVLVDIEADMYASVYSNTVFQKGGLLKAIVSVDQMENANVLNENTYFDISKKLQQLYERQYSGVRGAAQLLFTPLVKGVHNLMNPKDLEGAHQQTSERTATRTSMLLGCPPERIGVARTSQYQNITLIDDSVALAFDNHNYYLTGIVDEYINRELIQGVLGVNDIKLQSSGEYGSISKTAAEFGKLIAEMGADVMTVNEFRVKVLHFEPLDGPEGDRFIGENLNQVPAVGGAKKFLLGGKVFEKFHCHRDLRWL